MIEFDEYKVKLNNLKPALAELGEALKLDDAEREDRKSTRLNSSHGY